MLSFANFYASFSPARVGLIEIVDIHLSKIMKLLKGFL